MISKTLVRYHYEPQPRRSWSRATSGAGILEAEEGSYGMKATQYEFFPP